MLASAPASPAHKLDLRSVGATGACEFESDAPESDDFRQHGYEPGRAHFRRQSGSLPSGPRGDRSSSYARARGAKSDALALGGKAATAVSRPFVDEVESSREWAS